MNSRAQIFIGDNSFNDLEEFFTSPFSSCFVLADENTLKHCYPLVSELLPAHQVVLVAAGEHYKGIDTCRLIWTRLTEANADRKSLFINLGGGVIGDMGGFAASCFKRGIPFINIPTTLLAMVDASVGGKTGIDFMGFKNQVGLFSEPEAVFVYPVFLDTLSQRELTSGYAEVIKHYLIADKEGFESIRRSSSDIRQHNWLVEVKKNIEIKSNIVEKDPHEMGIRKALNFGHTIGHAIESYYLTDMEHYLLHGEAIAAGMITESFISLKKELLTLAELEQISKVILNYFDLPVIETDAQNKIAELIKQDKKNERKTPQFTLLSGIGNYAINITVEEETITESFNYYNSLLR